MDTASLYWSLCHWQQWGGKEVLVTETGAVGELAGQPVVTAQTPLLGRPPQHLPPSRKQVWWRSYSLVAPALLPHGVTAGQ